MLARNCKEAGGSHLGTCIDKVVFGSCCKLPNVTTSEELSQGQAPNDTVVNEPVATLGSFNATETNPGGINGPQDREQVDAEPSDLSYLEKPLSKMTHLEGE